MRAKLRPPLTKTGPTEAELRAAYDRARLADTNTTFEAAMKDHALRQCLARMVESDRRWASKARASGSRRLELMQGRSE